MEENTKIYRTPNKVLARMQVVHFGKILFNFEFVVLAVMLASVLSFIIPALYYLVLICIILISLGSVFVYPEFSSWFAGGETLSKIAEVLNASWKYTVPIILVLSAISIVCLCFDKNQKHIARNVISGIIAVIALVVLILKLVNTGGVA